MFRICTNCQAERTHAWEVEAFIKSTFNIWILS